MAKWTKKDEEKKVQETKEEAEILEELSGKFSAPVEAPVSEKVSDPIPEPEPEPEYKLGYNHDVMRKSCGKCGGTQLIIEPLYDEKSVKVGRKLTCNDCKTEYKESL